MTLHISVSVKMIWNVITQTYIYNGSDMIEKLFPNHKNSKMGIFHQKAAFLQVLIQIPRPLPSSDICNI